MRLIRLSILMKRSQSKFFESSKPKICITGANSYVGAHICKAFLDDHTYKVRATVRDPTDQSIMKSLQKAFGLENFEVMGVCKMDLNN